MNEKTVDRCRLCGSKGIERSYEGAMRHSGVGSGLVDDYAIHHCLECSVEFISPLPSEVLDSYRDGSYWGRKGGTARSDIERLHAKALVEQSLWIRKIGLSAFSGRRVLDFGCGAGTFLDAVKGVAASTVGIEQDPSLASFAGDNGHEVHASVDAAIAAGVMVDVMVSFDVFEHLEAPVETMKSLKRLLRPGAAVHIGVPNQDDVIKELVPAYLPHFYHVEHLWYFDAGSLSHVLEKADVSVKHVRYLHKYNFLNIVEWARTGAAPGVPHSPALDADLDARVCGWLEDRGVASHVLIEASR